MSAPEFTTAQMVNAMLARADSLRNAKEHAVKDKQPFMTEWFDRDERLYAAIAAHLSDPWSAFAGWQPPPEAERADGYRCLATHGRDIWFTAQHIPLGRNRPYAWCRVDTGQLVSPTAFAPLPPPPKESTATHAAPDEESAT